MRSVLSMADSRPNQKGRSPGASDKQSPVLLRPTWRALKVPEARAHGSCEDRGGPPVAVESDLSADMVAAARDRIKLQRRSLDDQSAQGAARCRDDLIDRRVVLSGVDFFLPTGHDAFRP